MVSTKIYFNYQTSTNSCFWSFLRTKGTMIQAKKVDFTLVKATERTQQLTINQVVAAAQHAALNVVRRGRQEASLQLR